MCCGCGNTTRPRRLSRPHHAPCKADRGGCQASQCHTCHLVPPAAPRCHLMPPRATLCHSALPDATQFKLLPCVVRRANRGGGQVPDCPDMPPSATCCTQMPRYATERNVILHSAT